jgi:hypothetical protein
VKLEDEISRWCSSNNATQIFEQTEQGPRYRIVVQQDSEVVRMMSVYIRPTPLILRAEMKSAANPQLQYSSGGLPVGTGTLARELDELKPVLLCLDRALLSERGSRTHVDPVVVPDTQ